MKEKEPFLCLGVEHTAHTFGIGIVDRNGKIYSNTKDTFIPKSGGINPKEAADHHHAVAEDVLEKSLNESGIDLEKIDFIAFSRGPGLPPCLRAGASFVEKLSSKIKKPVVGVNHPIAHIEIGRLTTRAKDPVCLYVSGGNTQILALVDGFYRVFGETLDIPIGNALDSFAREAGLGFPGGPKVEQLAKEGKWVELPYVVKGMDLSFSGIVTEALRIYRNGAKLEDVCYSLQETCFSMLIEVVERAVAHTDKEEVMLVGGVAANKRFSEMLEIMCKERGAKAYSVPPEYAGDCGANIAWAGLLISKEAKMQKNLSIKPKWRADEVKVTWL